MMLFLLLAITTISMTQAEERLEYVDAANPFTGIKGKTMRAIVSATKTNCVELRSLLPKSDEKSLHACQAIADAMRPRIPLLDCLGFFDWFSPLEWMESSTEPGRVLIGLLYLQRHPSNVDATILERLDDIARRWQSTFLSLEIERLKCLVSEEREEDPTELLAACAVASENTDVTNPFTGEKGVVQKGTISCLIHHVAHFEKLLQHPEMDQEIFDHLVKKSKELMTSMHSSGVFHWFLPSEWLSPSRPGRSLMALLYLEHMPERIDDTVRSQLLHLDQTTTSFEIKERIARLLQRN